MVFGDTNSAIANFSEVIDLINTTHQAMEGGYMVMGNLVTRHTIPTGQDRVRLNFQTQTMVAQDYTDGDEITNVQQYGIDSKDITPNLLEITYRISRRALKQPAVSLAAAAGEEQAKAAAEALEVRLLNTNPDDATVLQHGSGAAETLADVRAIRRKLRALARTDGGPPSSMVTAVISPVTEEDLLTDLGVTAGQLASTNVTPRVTDAVNQLLDISASLTEAYFGNIVRIPHFVSNYIGVTNGSVTSPSRVVYFTQDAVHLAVADEWEVEPFRTIDWPGISVRAMTDYGQSLGSFPKHLVSGNFAV